MIIIYGDYRLSFAISGTGAAFLTDPATLSNGRSGDGCAIQWLTSAGQNTASFLQLTATITAPFGEASPAIGGVGLVNMQGLPIGTKVQVGSVTQRLVAGPRGEPCAWTLPFTNGLTQQIKIFNDVNGSASIAPGTVFAPGEIIIGRAASLPVLVSENGPTNALVDTNGYDRSSGSQLHQFMRKPWWTNSQRLGLFTRRQAKGGATSSLQSGGNPASGIDVKTLMELLAVSRVFAVCDAPHAGDGTATLQNGIRFDKDFMQSNWMLARPIDMAQLVCDEDPYWTWNPKWQEAT